MGQPINPFQNAVGPAALPTSGPGAVGGGLPSAGSPPQQTTGEGLGNFLAGAGRFLARNAAPIALTAGSFIYQNRQRRKLKRRLNELAEQNRGIEIRFTPSAGEIGISYGYSGAPGYAVYAKTERRLPSVPGTFGTLAAHPDASKYDEFLLVQFVIGASGISRLLDLHINNDPVASDGLAELVSHELRQNEASPHVTAFTTERDANAIGTGFSVVNGFYRFDNDNRLISGIPSLLAFIEGELVRPLSGGSFGTEAFSRNAVLCLADYLTSSIYGPNFSDDDLELSTWQKAADLMEFNLSSQSIPDFHGVNIRDWGLAECNGNILTPGDFLDSLNAFLGVIPGAIVWRNLDGKWAISVPDVRTPLEDQIVGELTEDDFLVPPGKEYPDATLMLNGQTIEFPNLFDDYAADSLTYKNAGFLAKDRGIVLENTIGLELCGTPYHAQLISSTNVKTSRRPTYPGMVCRAHTLRFEPGDIVRINAPNFGINGDVVRLQDMRLFNDGTGNLFTTIDALEHSLSDFIYEPIKEATMRGVPKKNYRPGGILGAVLELIPNKVRQLKTTWDAESDTNNTKEYIIELAEMTNESDPIPDSAWQRIGIVPEGEVREFPHAIKDLPRCYTARVIPVSSNNVKGKPVITNTVGVRDARIDNLETLGSPNLCPNSNWQGLFSQALPGWDTAYNSIQLGLTRGSTGPLANVVNTVELVAGNILNKAPFTPNRQTPQDFRMPDNTKVFLYEAAGQIFARALGDNCSDLIKDVVGVNKPTIGQAHPSLPQVRGIAGPQGEMGKRGEPGPPGPPGGKCGNCPEPGTVLPGQIPPLRLPPIPSQDPCDFYKVGVPISITLPAATGGNPPLKYAASQIPDGTKFDPETRVVSGTPTKSGTFEIVYTVTDTPYTPDQMKEQMAIREEVCCCCPPPEPDPGDPLAPPPPLELPPIPTEPTDDCDFVPVGMSRTIQLPAPSGGKGKSTLKVTKIPPGMTFNPDTRQITGSPTEPGEYEYIYEVTDEDMATIEQRGTIRVEQNTNTYVDRIERVRAEVGKPIGQKLPAGAGGSGSGYTYDLMGNGVSPFLRSFDKRNRIMTGTPDLSDVGEHKLSYLCRDDNDRVFCRDFIIEVVDTAPQFVEVGGDCKRCATYDTNASLSLPRSPLLG